MPLYLVRWPTLAASIVRARNEADLMDRLDEVDDPGACRWTVYNGPLWVDLELPVQVEVPQEAALEDTTATLAGADELSEFVRFDADTGGCDTGGEMTEAVTRWAFPHLHALHAKLGGEEEPIPLADVEQALRAELRELWQYRWRVAQMETKTGHEAELMRNAGLTKAPPWFLKQAARSERDDEPDGET